MTIKHTAIALLGAGAVAGGCVAVASGDDGVSSDGTAAQGAQTVDQGAQTVDPATAFGVFRRGARAADAMPATERRILAPVAAREQVSLAEARAVAPSAGRAVWAIPGPDKVCLALPDPVDGYGISCSSGIDAANGRLWVELVGAPGQQVGDARVAELVPDGVDTVTSVAASGRQGAIAVADNVAFTDVSDADTLRFGSGDAARSVHIGRTLPSMVRGTG